MREALGSCPICAAELMITEYRCSGCGVTLGDEFRQSPLAALPPELAAFVVVFLETGGNISEVERRLGISYPTVKSRLAKANDVIAAASANRRPVRDDVKAVLEAVRDGDLEAGDALRYL